MTNIGVLKKFSIKKVCSLEINVFPIFPFSLFLLFPLTLKMKLTLTSPVSKEGVMIFRNSLNVFQGK